MTKYGRWAQPPNIKKSCVQIPFLPFSVSLFSIAFTFVYNFLHRSIDPPDLFSHRSSITRVTRAGSRHSRNTAKSAKRRNEHHGISANLQCLGRIRSPLQVFLPSDPSRPLQLTAQLISTNCRCHRLLLGIGTIMPGGWWLPQPPPPPPSDQTQTPRCGYAIFLAAFYGHSPFLGCPLGILSKTTST